MWVATDPESLVARRDFLWHQRFQIAPGVFTPGVNDIEWLLHQAGVPADLTGLSVLDIGTSNGGAAFELERRGASRVVATDITDEDHFGFAEIRRALGSDAEFRRLTVYELDRLDEQFDLVCCLGVLYHVRHPLLALDNVRTVTRGVAYVESAICDWQLPQGAELPLARFHPFDDLAGDTSNWFTPSLSALGAWCESCGLAPRTVRSWPAGAPTRGLVVAEVVPGRPQYRQLSPELPLRVRVSPEAVEPRPAS